MTASNWFGRILCLLITFGSAWVKHNFFQFEASILGVGISQCLSGLCNAIAVISAAYFVAGSASYDLQLLGFCAVIINLASFIAFAAKNSPMVSLLNQTITVISVAQFVRLIWPSNGSPLDFCRRGVLLGFARLSAASIHFKKETS